MEVCTNDLICFTILLWNTCHNGGHFENKMAAIALKFVAISIYFKHKLILRKFSLEVFHYHACWVVDAYNITFSNCTATL
jgi:hypothetical protein